jgi:hypothetical protein
MERSISIYTADTYCTWAMVRITKDSNNWNFKITISNIFILKFFSMVTVLDTKSQNIPEVVIVRRGQVGFWEFGKGGSTGRRVGQTGSVYKQPEREVDDSYHNWRVPSK